MELALLLVTALATTDSLAPKQGDCPCCFAEARQFDFWIGDWETYTPDGKLAGTNSISVLEDSCLIRERWKSHQSTFTGTSYNFYNSRTGRWQQLWIDNQGGNLQLEGNFNGTAMVLRSEELPNRDNTPQIDRITWTPDPDGTVRQLWEVSTDKGQTWQVVFDGLYKRKKR